MGISCLGSIEKRRLWTSSMIQTEMAVCSRSFLVGIAMVTPSSAPLPAIFFFFEKFEIEEPNINNLSPTKNRDTEGK